MTNHEMGTMPKIGGTWEFREGCWHERAEKRKKVGFFNRNQLGQYFGKLILLIFIMNMQGNNPSLNKPLLKKHGDTILEGKIIGEDAHCLFSIAHETR